MPIALQGRAMPIISDSECSSRAGSSFQSSSMVCVFDGQGGACNVSREERLTMASVIAGMYLKEKSYSSSGLVSLSLHPTGPD